MVKGKVIAQIANFIWYVLIPYQNQTIYGCLRSCDKLL